MRGWAEVCICIVLCSMAAAAGKKGSSSEIHSRTILADELRDFPGVCFASTQCGTVKVGDTWELKPFCGRSTCGKAEDGRLVEVVEDCGPAPEGCKINSRRTRVDEPFPDCCPVYDCSAVENDQPDEEQFTKESRRTGTRGSRRRTYRIRGEDSNN